MAGVLASLGASADFHQFRGNAWKATLCVVFVSISSFWLHAGFLVLASFQTLRTALFGGLIAASVWGLALHIYFAVAQSGLASTAALTGLGMAATALAFERRLGVPRDSSLLASFNCGAASLVIAAAIYYQATGELVYR
jgi:hypothetical protein